MVAILPNENPVSSAPGEVKCYNTRGHLYTSVTVRKFIQKCNR